MTFLLQRYTDNTPRPLYREPLVRYYWKVMIIGDAYSLFGDFAIFTRRDPGGRSRA